MPFTLEQIEFLRANLAVEIPEELIENKKRAEAFKRRSGELAARSDEMQSRSDGAALKALLNEAQTAAQGQNFGPALQLLDQLEEKLSVPDAPPWDNPPATPPETAAPAEKPMAQRDPAKDGILVKLQSSRHRWNETRNQVRTELNALEQAILEECKKMNADPGEEFEVDLNELGQQTKQLFGIMERMDERLIDKLDEALQAKDAEREQKHKEAAGIVKEYQAILESDSLVAQIDNSGFLDTKIRQTFAQALEELAGNL